MIYTSPTGTKYKLQDRQDIIYTVLQDTGYFEEHLINVAEEYLRNVPGNVVDVGANIGAICIELATRFRDIEFYAFEPLNLAFSELQTNIALNNYTNIKAYNVALSDCDEILTGENPSPGHSFGHVALKHDINVLRDSVPSEFAEYPATTLDSFQFENISVLKIDVEGMEIYVLKGAIDTIKRCRPLIIFEAWGADWFKEERQKVIDFVLGLGYELDFRFGDNIIATPN